MADGYDRFENEGGGGGSFVMGLLTGTVLGAGLGMLFAPKAGSELRGQIGEQANNFANQAKEGYQKASESAGQWAEKGRETASEWAERGKDVYDKAKDAVSRGADEAQKYVRDATSSGPGSTSAPSSASSGGSSYGSPSGSSGGSHSPSTAGNSGRESSGSSGTSGGSRRS
jgi:gas vesicle protein